MQELTDTQKKALEFILRQIESTGMPPTLREIASYFQWKSVGSAQDIVAALRKKGVLLTPMAGKARQIVPTQSENNNIFSSEDFLKVPLLGNVQAGLPLEVLEESHELISFPTMPKKTKHGEKYFALTVEGYSMVNAGFLPQDIILVEATKLAHDKDIVVANIQHNEVTVKRYAQKGTSLYKMAQNNFNENILPPAFLVPENPNFSPLPFGIQEEDRIIGVVKSLFRKSIY